MLSPLASIFASTPFDRQAPSLLAITLSRRACPRSFGRARGPQEAQQRLMAANQHTMGRASDMAWEWAHRCVSYGTRRSEYSSRDLRIDQEAQLARGTLCCTTLCRPRAATRARAVTRPHTAYTGTLRRRMCNRGDRIIYAKVSSPLSTLARRPRSRPLDADETTRRCPS